MKLRFITLFFLFITQLGFAQKKRFTLTQKEWGKDGTEKIFLLDIKNPNGMHIQLTNYGAILVKAEVPDRNQKMEDVVLGFDNLAQYQKPNPLFGATVGRFANRIRNGEFEIEGVKYQLNTKGEKHAIHGGGEFSSAVWKVESTFKDKHKAGVIFFYFSKDGSNGFPGNVQSKVTYTLTDKNEIKIDFEATTDKDTHISMTNHSYFNLNGMKNTILDQKIKIDANSITAIDKDIVPTGQLEDIRNTEKDLTVQKAIGENIFKLSNNGYHFCYVFNKENGKAKKVIEIVDPTSGRTLNVITTQPSVQFYTGNSLDGKFVGKEGKAYGKHIAFCLETQHLPDTPNHPNFPSSLVKAGETYKETVIYQFGIDQKLNN
ncbi:aldose epimerase family protein [Flammeovirga sp. EKP202]|uniref:aldose epimerase family protein n=1 Tax=Flammeovirga sp. EKP202 TaxID=2770592 RepID=UPI00165F6CCA|nr:aldose epimerase family protein [Flammeovirga sp. EKP202]MBD0401453.1 galactose mutarotase [Flammeovirga sp. EKP202]